MFFLCCVYVFLLCCFSFLNTFLLLPCANKYDDDKKQSNRFFLQTFWTFMMVSGNPDPDPHPGSFSTCSTFENMALQAGAC